MVTMMAADNNDNNVDGDGAMGNKVDDDGDNATGDDNGNDDDGDDDNDGKGNGVMGSGATGYDDYNNGNGRHRRQRR